MQMHITTKMNSIDDAVEERMPIILSVLHWNSADAFRNDTILFTLKEMIQMAYGLVQHDVVAQWCPLGMGDDQPRLS